MFRIDFEKLGIVGMIIACIIAIAVIIAYVWILWIVAGAALTYLAYTGGHEFALKIFIMIVITAVLGALGRIGSK